jgi:hypothetical protein
MSTLISACIAKWKEHNFFETNDLKDLKLCRNCGVLRINEVNFTFIKICTLKENIFLSSIEFDEIEDFKNKIKEEWKLPLNYNNDSHREYLERRKVIMKSLKKLFGKFEFKESVFFLAVNYLDAILLSSPNFNYDVAIYSSFVLASKVFLTSGKFYESDPKLPKMKQIAYSIEGDFSEKDIKTSEIICLKLLDYKLDRTTSYDLLESFLKNGIVFENEVNVVSCQNMKEMNDLAFSILKNFVYDTRYLDFTPLQVAASVVSYVRKKFQLKSWNRLLEKIYSIKQDYFINCYFILTTIISDFSYDVYSQNSLVLSQCNQAISPRSNQSSLNLFNLPFSFLANLEEDEVRTPNNILAAGKPLHLYSRYLLTNYTNEDMNSTMEEEGNFTFYSKTATAFSTRKMSERQKTNNNILLSTVKNLNQSFVNKLSYSGFKSLVSPFSLEGKYFQNDLRDIFKKNFNNNFNNNNDNLYNYMFQ